MGKESVPDSVAKRTVASVAAERGGVEVGVIVG